MTTSNLKEALTHLEAAKLAFEQFNLTHAMRPSPNGVGCELYKRHIAETSIATAINQISDIEAMSSN